MNLNEQNLTEQPVIEWFKQFGYEYKFGPEISPGGIEILIERDFKDVILEKRLKSALKRLNPDLPEKAIDEAIYKLKKIEYPNLEIANKEVYEMLRNGIKVDVEDENKSLRGKFVKVIDFEDPLNNEFLVVNQFTVQGIDLPAEASAQAGRVRRPDVVVFINGVPIAIFELKNPTIEETTIQTAYQQLQEYKKDIPEIFKYNQILVISDLVEAKYGTISASWEWFKKWRGIEDSDEKLKGVSELEVLVKGIFQKSRILDIIKNFIVFEADSEKDFSKFIKKICLYHQYFGVNKAIRETLRASGQLPSSNFSQEEKNYRGNFEFSGLISKARELRKNQTKAEEIFWEILRNRQFLNLKFRRQHQIGDYIVDFYCPELKLVIEIDGEIHNTEEQSKKDSKREAYLKSLGNNILRFSNQRIFEDLDGVLQDIAQYTSPTGRGYGEGYANRKIGVLWHTQGSGKTLSMVFYVNKAKELKELQSPTFVFLTDRNDLDNQFYKTFLRTGYSALAKQAETIKGLEEKLKTAGAELIFTTIQKFGENFGVLSEKENIIVIADEAHRSEYAELAARARNAMPNASFMGITATPIDAENRNTRLVFGDYIDKYPMSRSVEDGATVPIYYESRLVPLHLTNYFIDDEFEELTQEVRDIEVKESLKRKFARLEQAVSVPDRLKQIAEDIVNHFNSRGLEGKAMVVTISRRVAVEMYKLIKELPNAPEVAVVISNPNEFKNEIQEETKASELEKRFKNPQDPLKMVVVCDMWLTGFDVPCLTTMYFDKPLKNHGLMQAIARVNRVFKDKQGGLIVDYIGIADDLKKALSIYDEPTRNETMISIDEIVNKMLEKYDVVKSMLSGVDYSKWKYLEGEQLSQLFQQAINTIITHPEDETLDDNKKERFLKESLALIKLHAFVMPHEEAYKIKNDVEFFKALRSALIKQTVTRKEISEIGFDFDSTVKELLSKSIAAEGIIDIFAMKGKEKINISILDEKFLEEAKKLKYKNLTIEVLRKLLEDEIGLRIKKNKIRYYSLSELLEKIIEEYENRVISASKVIERLIELAQEIKKADKEALETGLSEEELAFYDAIASKKMIKQDEKIKELVKELVKMIRRDLTIDWTNSEIVKARIKANAKLLLLQNNFKQEETEEITDLIYQQAFILYKDYNPKVFSVG
jgi:type I restriction enzyme R subunit